MVRFDDQGSFMSFAARTASGTASSGALAAYLKNNNYSALAVSPFTATANFRANASGSILVTATVGGETYTWLIGGGTSSNYSIRLTVASGTGPNESGSALVGTWLPLSVDYYWGLERTAVGNTNGTYTIEIAETAVLSNILASASIFMSATAGL